MDASQKPDSRDPAHHHPILAIDCGVSGGLAWRDWTGTTYARPLPRALSPLLDVLRDAVAACAPRVALVEDVGYHRSGNNAQGSATLARNVGQIESAIRCCGVPIYWVPPKKWQAGVPFAALPKRCPGGPPGKGARAGKKVSASAKPDFDETPDFDGPPLSPTPTETPTETPKERQKRLADFQRLRKRLIKELMRRQYPGCKVTLKTADALGILHWGVHSPTVRNVIDVQQHLAPNGCNV